MEREKRGIEGRKDEEWNEGRRERVLTDRQTDIRREGVSKEQNEVGARNIRIAMGEGKRN